MSKIFVLMLGCAAIVAFQGCTSSRTADTLEHLRYEQDGKPIDKATYDREFQKNPASVSECARNVHTGETLCGAG